MTGRGHQSATALSEGADRAPLSVLAARLCCKPGGGVNGNMRGLSTLLVDRLRWGAVVSLA